MTTQYKRWNDAIRKHLFENNSDNEEVYLYITTDVLDDISIQNPRENLGGHEGFEACVKAIYAEDGNRCSRLHQLWRENCGCAINRTSSRYFKSKSVFKCALGFTATEINSTFKCGYLNILAYALLKLNDCSKDNERAIGNFLIRAFENEFQSNENGKFGCISDLFAHLSNQYPVFKDISLNGYPHVGRLRYQLILTPSQIAKLRDLLYTRCISTASTDSYETTINKIHGYADEEIKLILGLSMSQPHYRQRIQNVFSSFDFDAYAASHESINGPRIKGNLYHALCFDDNGCRPILLSDICNVNLSLQSSKALTISIIAEPDDRILDLNPNHVVRNGSSDRFELDEAIEIKDKEVRLSTRNNSGIWLLELEESNDNKYYIETENPTPHKTIYVVVDVDREKILKSILNKTDFNEVFNPISKSGPELIPEVIGENRYLFECKGSAIIPLINRQYRTLREGNKGNDINKKGGVLHPFHKNEYLVNCLPEYVFPLGIDTKGISLNIYIDDKEFKDFELITNNKNGIFVDILDFSSIGTARASRLELVWKLGGKTLFEDTLYVIKADGNYNEGALRKLDEWGQPIKDDSVQAFHAWGGKCSSESNHNKTLSGFSSNLRKLENLNNPDDSDLKKFKTHYLINLIAAIGLSDPNMMIRRSRLKECIQMASARFGFSMDEEKHIKTVVSKLLSLGYVLPIYGEGQTRYQVLPPMFVKSQPPVRVDKKQGGDPYIWILMGCYTRGFLDALMKHQNKLIMTIRDDESPKLVGNRIVLHHTFDPNEFTEGTGYKCLVIDYDLISEILSNIPTENKYWESLKEIPQFGVSLMPEDKSSFPRVRESSELIYRKSRYIEKENGIFYESKVADPGWMSLAVAKRDGSANVILTDINFLWPTHLRLPSILERVLGMLNVCEPERIRAFVVDSVEERHALFCDYIQYGLDTGNAVSNQLKRIFGSDGQLYSNARVLLITNLTLYVKKDRFSKAPVYALVYSICKDKIDLVTYWFGWNVKPLAYLVNNGNGFDKVDMTDYGDGALGINKLMSTLIKDNNSLRIIPVLSTSNVAELPYSLDGYHSTTLKVIQKK